MPTWLHMQYLPNINNSVLWPSRWMVTRIQSWDVYNFNVLSAVDHHLTIWYLTTKVLILGVLGFLPIWQWRLEPTWIGLWLEFAKLSHHLKLLRWDSRGGASYYPYQPALSITQIPEMHCRDAGGAAHRPNVGAHSVNLAAETSPSLPRSNKCGLKEDSWTNLSQRHTC